MTRFFVLAAWLLAAALPAAAQADLSELGLDALERRVEASPSDAEARRALADRLTAEGQPTEAIPHLRWLAEHDPADLAVRQQLARHLLWADRAPEAVPVLESIVAMDPEADAERLQLAQIITWDGGAARAAELLAPLAERSAEDAAVQKAYAFALLASEDAGARRQLSRALVLAPDDPDLLVESGALERWQGDWSLGRERLLRARRQPLTVAQRTRVRDLLDGLTRETAPTLTSSAARREDSNGVTRVEAPLRLRVPVDSRWTFGVELSGDQIGSDATTATVEAGRVVPSVAYSPQRGTRIEVAAGAELVDATNTVTLARALVEQVWAGERFALARLAVATASATDAASALNSGIRRTRVVAEGYAEPASAVAISGSVGTLFYSDGNRRLQAAANAQWLPVRLGAREEGAPAFAFGPTVGALYEDSETLYPTSTPYYTPDQLATLSLGLAARIAAGAGFSAEGVAGLAHQTGPASDATSAELGLALGYDRQRHAVRLEARRSGSSVYSADVFRLTYLFRSW